MLLTEDEARTRWCPFVRQAWADFDTDGRYTTRGDGAVGFNMVHENRGPRERRSPCIASGCMAWRRVVALPGRTGEVEVGYCGLAGKPKSVPELEEAVAAVGMLSKPATPAAA